MPIELKGKTAKCLEEEFKNMREWNNNNSTLENIEDGKEFNTIGDFYDNFIKPKLPKKEIVINWTNLLLDYVKGNSRVFAVRSFFNYKKVNSDDKDEDSELAKNKIKAKKGDNNPYSLRRGFLTVFSNIDHKYFFSDNFFAAYFLKMAYDGFVPEIDDFNSHMQNKTFPGRFGRYCKEETAVAAYDITGQVAKDPGIKNKGYKIGHVIDSAMNYIDEKKNLNLQEICSRYFPRGCYKDWKDKVRTMELEQGGLNYLKAHFLRFVCPINYFLAPKKNDNKRLYQEYGPNSKLTTNKPDIAELTVLQKYIIGRFHQRYGEIYEKYLTAIMWKKDETEVTEALKEIEGKMEELAKIPIYLTVKCTPQSKSNVSLKKSSNQNHTPQSKNKKINFDQNIITMTPADREAYLLNAVPNNYKSSNSLKKIQEINGIVNTLFPGRKLFDLTEAKEIINVWKEVKKQPWNDKTSRGIPSAIVSNYCMAVTGQKPKR